MVGHITPEAIDGGTLALIKNGDEITIDADSREITLNVPKRELERRRRAWKKPAAKEKTGVLAKYSRLVSSASQGAVTDRV